jgi:hypothetical protein
MPVVTFKHFPLADRVMSWSFSGADGNTLIERGGWSLFKQAHTWFDDADGIPLKTSLLINYLTTRL